MTSAGTKQLRVQSRSCWWVCKWAASGMVCSLKNVLFRYVTSSKKSSLLCRLQQTQSITCGFMSHQGLCWHSGVTPSCIKYHLLKDLQYSSPWTLAVMQIFVQDLSVLWRKKKENTMGVARMRPHFCFSAAESCLSCTVNTCCLVCFRAYTTFSLWHFHFHLPSFPAIWVTVRHSLRPKYPW